MSFTKFQIKSALKIARENTRVQLSKEMIDLMSTEETTTEQKADLKKDLT